MIPNLTKDWIIESKYIICSLYHRMGTVFGLRIKHTYFIKMMRRHLTNAPRMCSSQPASTFAANSSDVDAP